jgi:hypothetical protein
MRLVSPKADYARKDMVQMATGSRIGRAFALPDCEPPMKADFHPGLLNDKAVELPNLIFAIFSSARVLRIALTPRAVRLPGELSEEHKSYAPYPKIPQPPAGFGDLSRWHRPSQKPVCPDRTIQSCPETGSPRTRHEHHERLE